MVLSLLCHLMFKLNYKLSNDTVTENQSKNSMHQCQFNLMELFFLYKNIKKYKKKKHHRLKAVFLQGTNSDIARNTAPEKK